MEVKSTTNRIVPATSDSNPASLRRPKTSARKARILKTSASVSGWATIQRALPATNMLARDPGSGAAAENDRLRRRRRWCASALEEDDDRGNGESAADDRERQQRPIGEPADGDRDRSDDQRQHQRDD